MAPLLTLNCRFRALVAWVMLLAILNSGAEEGKPAQIVVSGYGPLGDRNLKKVLTLVQPPGRKLEFLDANFIEDAVLLLMSRLHEDGFLHPKITVEITLADGARASYQWTQPVREEPLPRPLQARRAEFKITKGILYHFGSLELRGFTALSPEAARGYFIESGALLPLKRTRVYSPTRMQRGLENLSDALRRRGYESADAKVASLKEDDRTGRVDAIVQVAEGPRSLVRSIREEFYREGDTNPVRVVAIRTNTPFSTVWLQDFTQQLRATNYHQGYPDTTVSVTQLQRDRHDGFIDIDLLAQVKSGPQVWLGEVSFKGEKKTKLSIMERRVRLKEGSLLDRVLVEEGRDRLARLGVFDSVGLSYEVVDEHTRDVVYQVKEGKTIDFSLLFGYGSYELLRGGIEVEQNNIFGLAHHDRLLLVQSIKSSSGEYVYTIPELVGRDVDLFLNASALRREEISFTREEFGGGFGARRYFKPIETDVSLRYNYQVLNATAPGLAFQEGLPTADVGSVIADVRHDRRDNPLYPHKGYKVFGNYELGSDYLGGNANYQRIELMTSYHRPLDAGRWVHFGLSHGLIVSPGNAAQDLPFNRRFFPGGENSIRGYQEGEAAPRDSKGNVIGAECYLLGRVELEQALTPAWSVVGFLDTVTFARDLIHYPGNETLYSVGGGIQWKTIIGPVRLEYGYNLNRRRYDPSGTIQFSVGFPF